MFESKVGSSGQDCFVSVWLRLYFAALVTLLTVLFLVMHSHGSCRTTVKQTPSSAQAEYGHFAILAFATGHLPHMLI